MKNWDYQYFQKIGPLFDDDGNNVDGKVKDFIQNLLEERVKEVNRIWREEMTKMANKKIQVIKELFVEITEIT